MLHARTTRLPIGLLVLFLASLPGTGRCDETTYNLKAIDGYILPGYARLAVTSEQLAKEMRSFCHTPDEDRWSQARAAYHQAMDSWQYIQVIRFGPIEHSLRGYRMQFWPDKRQSVSRHLARLLDKPDPNALEPQTFANASVALQGFSALERLLFDPDTLSGEFGQSGTNAFHCQLMQAITRNMAGIAKALLSEWQKGASSHRALIASASLGNKAYADGAEVSARLFNSLFTQIELMLDGKLLAPLGESLQMARGRRSESWRSSRSLRNLTTNLQAVQKLTQLAFISRLADPLLNKRIEDQMAICHQRIEHIALPLHLAVADSSQRQHVKRLLAALSKLKQILITELAPALEIPIGFNSLDGD